MAKTFRVVIHHTSGKKVSYQVTEEEKAAILDQYWELGLPILDFTVGDKQVLVTKANIDRLEIT